MRLKPRLSGGGLTLPVGRRVTTATDTAWFANTASISAFNGTSSDYTGAATDFALCKHRQSGIAIDASGNIWTANTGDNSVSVFVGLAAPVVTPLAANVGP